MFRPEGLLYDRQGALVERLGLGVAALAFVKRGEVVEVLCDVRMLRPEGLLPDRQGALEEGLGVPVAALGFVQPGEVVEALCVDRRGILTPLVG